MRRSEAAKHRTRRRKAKPDARADREREPPRPLPRAELHSGLGPFGRDGPDPRQCWMLDACPRQVYAETDGQDLPDGRIATGHG